MYNLHWKVIEEGEKVLNTVDEISRELLSLFIGGADVYEAVRQISDLLDEIHKDVEVLIATVSGESITFGFAKSKTPLLRNLTIPTSKKCLLCYIADKGEEIYLENLWEFSKGEYRVSVPKGLNVKKHAFFGIPVTYSEKTIGIIGFIAESDSFTEEKKGAFRLIARILGCFMRDFKGASDAFDKLTGALKREYFFSVLNELKGFVMIVIIDVEDLSQINRALGYRKGDEVLRLLATITKSRIEENEMLIRFKEDMFVVLLRRKLDVEEFIRGISKDLMRMAGIPVNLKYGVSEIKENVESALNKAIMDSKIYRQNLENVSKSGYSVITEEDLKEYEDSDKGVVIHTIDEILYANKKVLKIIGVRSMEDLAGFNAMSFTPAEYREMAYRRAKVVIETGAKLPPAVEKGIMVDGRTATFVVNSIPVIFKGKKAVMLFIEDVSSFVMKESIENFLNIISEFLSDLISSSSSTCESLLNIARKVLPNVNIALFEIRGNTCLLMCGRVEREFVAEREFPLEAMPVVERYVMIGKDILFPDLRRFGEDFRCPLGLKSPSISHYGYPIRIGGDVRFILMASRLGYNSISPYEVDLLRTVASHIEKNLKMQSLERKLEEFKEKAFKDPLTGTFTRAFFDEWFRSHEDMLVDPGKTFSVVIADIDCLKVINDTFGHDFGDVILKKFSKDIMRSLRDTDIIVRWGGDEFLILLQGADERKAEEIIKRARFSTGVSFSYGISSMKGKSFREAFKEADELLYIKKRRREECEKLMETYESTFRRD